MTLEIKFPRVLEPKSLEDLATVYYESMYENKDESKKLIKNLDEYCLDFNFNERAYMYTYMTKAQHVAKKMKKIKRRNFVRKEKAWKTYKIDLEEATINKNRYISALEEIKNNELEKTRKIFGGGANVLSPLTSSASLAISHAYYNIPKEPSALIAGLVGVITYATFKVVGSRRTKKTIKKCCEDQKGIEKYYSDRERQIEGNFSIELLTIEENKESEERKHISRDVRDLEKAWRTYGIDLEESVEFGVLMKMLS